MLNSVFHVSPAFPGFDETGVLGEVDHRPVAIRYVAIDWPDHFQDSSQECPRKPPVGPQDGEVELLALRCRVRHCKPYDRVPAVAADAGNRIRKRRQFFA